MSHRTPPDPYRMRPRHDDAEMALVRMCTEFIVTLEAGETIGKVQRENAIAIIHQHRPELQNCTTRFSDLLKHIADERMMNHADLVLWMTNLSVDLKFINVDEIPIDIGHRRPITVERMKEGMKLAMALESCREQTVFYR
jgi:hypothetical protein